jgi:hypothetical protein
MHLLQPQTEVNVSSLMSTISTLDSDISTDQVQLSAWEKLSTETEHVDGSSYTLIIGFPT